MDLNWYVRTVRRGVSIGCRTDDRETGPDRRLTFEEREEISRRLAITRGTQRRPHGRPVGAGRLQHMVMITDRPAEAADRAVPGHWEGDLVLGQHGQSAVGTLVERTSWYVVLFGLPKGRLAEHVRTALARRIRTLP